MGTFSASLRAVGDVNSLVATIELADGRLRIAVGDTEIGNWPLADIHLEEISTGFRMTAEGELLVIELKDTSSFVAALEASSEERRGIGRSKADLPRNEDTGDRSTVPLDDPAAVDPPSFRTGQKAALVAPEAHTPTKTDRSGVGTRILDTVDGLLSKAKKRAGAYLPEWMFSRGMFVIAVVTLALLVAFPGVSSLVLLVLGGLGVLFGAVVYSDSVLASHWLPGRATPPQALLTALAIFCVGILLGVIAR